MSAGMASNPTPWWTLPGGNASRVASEKAAPPGYEFDPVKRAYVRTPTSAGARINQYTSAATGQGLSSSLAGLQSAAGGYTGGNMGSSSGGGVTGGGAGIQGGSAVPGIADVDTTASNAAIFGRAKDTQGQIGRASLDSLRGILGETGQLGSGAEVQGSVNIAQNAAGELGQVNRDLATSNASQSADNARTNYQGQITQRGQNIAAQEAQARIQQQQAALESQRQLQLLQMALGQQSQAQANAPSFLY